MRSLPVIFSQNDDKWKDKKFGDFPANERNDSTFGKYGCYVVSYATIARYYGKITDPEQITQYLIEHKLLDGNLIKADDALSKIYPDIKYEKTYHYQNEPAQLDLLHSLLDDPTLSIIIDISFREGHHFTPVIGCNGVVTIANPYDGQIQEFSKYYGDPNKNILRYFVFSGVPASAKQEEYNNSVREEANINWDAFISVASHAGIQADPSDKKGSANKINLIIDQLKEEINELKTEITNKNDLYKKATIENSQLRGELEKAYLDLANLHKQDKTVVDEGIAATELLHTQEEAFSKIAESIGLEGIFDSSLHLADEIITRFEETTKDNNPTIGQQITQNDAGNSNNQVVANPRHLEEKKDKTTYLLQAIKRFINLFFIINK